MNQAADPARALQLADALPLSPSPETAPVTIRPRYGHFIGGKLRGRREEGTFATVDPATGKELAKIAAATPARSTRPSAPPAAHDNVWGKLSGCRARQVPVPDRPPPPGALPRARGARDADNGKPIRETRDVDVPLAAAHFFYYAGWADKLEYAAAGRRIAGPWASAARSSPGTSRS
jgi:aldehyde dehydrogenase (NAD+)